MSQKTLIFIKFILGNLLQSAQVFGLALIIYFAIKSDQSFGLSLAFSLFWIYLLPPLIVRLIYFVFGRPQGRMTPQERGFWVWYVGAQLQSIYLRFSFFEELLRSFPLVYSAWLRLWGAEIGRGIYWAPRIFMLDRTHLIIEDFVLVGFGVAFSGHMLNGAGDDLELILESPHVKKYAVLGGLSGLSPGSVVEERETLPTTMGLAPYYAWKKGRRHALNSIGSNS